MQSSIDWYWYTTFATPLRVRSIRTLCIIIILSITCHEGNKLKFIYNNEKQRSRRFIVISRMFAIKINRGCGAHGYIDYSRVNHVRKWWMGYIKAYASICFDYIQSKPMDKIHWLWYKHKHAKSEWITKEIIKSIKFRDNLYIKLKQTPLNTAAYVNQSTNLKTYNKILKRNIAQAKRLYYLNSFNKYTNNAQTHSKLLK